MDAATVCADVRAMPTPLTPTVNFLVDGSGSMQCVYPEDGSCGCDDQLLGNCVAGGAGNRWESLGHALFDSAATGGKDGPVVTLQSLIRFGMTIYNNGVDVDNSACPNLPVAVTADLDNHAALRGAYPAAPPGANTPTGPALAGLVATLPDAATRRAQGLGPDTIVLATDGQPFTCVDPVALTRDLDYASVLDATRAAAAKGIAVYVISLAPASGDFATHLDAVAAEGGTGQAYQPVDEAALTSRLRAIVSDQVSCEIQLDGEVRVGDECEGKVSLSGSRLPCNDDDGWKLVDPNHIVLQGAACATFKQDPNAKLEATFPCGIFVPG